MKKSIKVDEEIFKMLVEKKYQGAFKTISDVIKYLLILFKNK
jgi:hypothetical protein